jgi:hypothetical protein
MIAVEGYSLEQHKGEYASWPLRSRLMLDGVPTVAKIRGYVIDAAYRCRAGVLVISNDDCPFEEAAHCTLLSANYRVLAQRSLAVPYGSFLLCGLWPDSAGLCLHFSDSEFFLLRIKTMWLTRWPYISLQSVPPDAWNADMRAAEQRYREKLSAIRRATDAVGR